MICRLYVEINSPGFGFGWVLEFFLIDKAVPEHMVGSLGYSGKNGGGDLDALPVG